MFDRFGEFDSVEELNRAAKAQLDEGDEEALLILAEENGIDKEDAEDYMDGCTDELATPLMAALGKLSVEAEELKISGTLRDWVTELEQYCTESSEMAIAVRQKSHKLEELIALFADYGFKNKTVVDTRIINHCSKELKAIVGNHPFYIGIPDKFTRRRLTKEYYLGGK